ncbi:MAG TPA: hypothetical protein VNA19_10630 [Pyrinomonadaceae bacterium]|jgi:hypothetical protein|nr:hypothetical protein [Pyrinomonadaceae bacterium]
MAVQESYEEKITNALRESAHGRFDWGGSGAVLELYESAGGEERDELIRAIGRIIEEDEDPSVVAQLIHIASSLDIAQVEPNVEHLKEKHPEEDDIVGKAVSNFLALRRFRAHGRAAASEHLEMLAEE